MDTRIHINNDAENMHHPPLFSPHMKTPPVSSDDTHSTPDTASDLLSELRGYVKKKGIGPTMSKHLTASECDRLAILLQEPSIPLSTKATLMTSMMYLEATPAETDWQDYVTRHHTAFLPRELSALFFDKSAPTEAASPAAATSTTSTTSSTIPGPSDFIGTSNLTTYIQDMMQNRHLSYDAASDAATLILAPAQPDYLKAAFLEAARLKRETYDENRAFLNRFYSRSSHTECDVDLLVDLSYAYDGFNRHDCLTPFIAATLAACGLHVSLHGCDAVAPKLGVTSFQILTAAGKNPLKSLRDVADAIQSPDIGWGYADQSLSFPTLYQLKPLRFDMVKRPILATVEKLIQPMVGRQNVIFTGYTHPPYKAMTHQLLRECGWWNSGYLIRGLEGSVMCGLEKRAPLLSLTQHPTDETYVSCDEYGLPRWGMTEKGVRPGTDQVIGRGVRHSAGQGATQDDPILNRVQSSLALGLSALNGHPGIGFDSVSYNAALILHRVLDCSPQEAISRVRHCLQSGRAMAHWSAY